MSPRSCVCTAELASAAPFRSPAGDRWAACLLASALDSTRSCRVPSPHRAASALPMYACSSIARPPQSGFLQVPLSKAPRPNVPPVPQLSAPRRSRSTLTTYRDAFSRACSVGGPVPHGCLSGVIYLGGGKGWCHQQSIGTGLAARVSGAYNPCSVKPCITLFHRKKAWIPKTDEKRNGQWRNSQSSPSPVGKPWP